MSNRPIAILFLLCSIVAIMSLVSHCDGQEIEAMTQMETRIGDRIISFIWRFTAALVGLAVVAGAIGAGGLYLFARAKKQIGL